jgi:hypothetical protein
MSQVDSSEPANTNIFTKLVNKVQYVTSNSLDDPKAAEFAKQKAIQDAQDKAVKDRKAVADEEAAKQAKIEKDKEIKSKELESRSEFNISRLTGNTASGILKVFFSFILFSLILYSGHIVANRDIGYNAPFRVLSFIYGSVFFFYHIPKTIYDVYVSNKKLEYYTFLPLSTYQPDGIITKLFLGPFCYTETQHTAAARSTVEALYSEGFQKTQIKTP